MLLDEMLKIGEFIFESFLHIWPYLVVTIPVAENRERRNRAGMASFP